ncbi:uncharacterized protein LOC18434829 isoform X2 [Amborella trichopoda]|uniref:uncharacterized protein LOC18434829 isoform X2 n=1 Tax=Amborella trichopoda TaxID=13333 RepID=UPI0005D391C0|nr:uncharacterized protein LOC18434829 isoform X2 [Amborella trichopoda]|eukprot:XP_011623625.1 uncharacterized protein LOC18434829 isoform X2 [Amborella trichopoda]
MAAASSTTLNTSSLSTHSHHLKNLKKPLSKLKSQFLPNPGFLLKSSLSLELYRRKWRNRGNGLAITAYMERPNSFGGFVRNVVGSLPVVGLLARILSDEGGVGGDLVDFAEFRRRVGKRCSNIDSQAFYDFKERRGRRRDKLKSASPEIPMALRAEKALETIYVCCFGKDLIEEEDEKLLCIMLNAVFQTVGQEEINRMVNLKAKQAAENKEQEPSEKQQTLSNEARQLQLKELEFLKQNSESFQ